MIPRFRNTIAPMKQCICLLALLGSFSLLTAQRSERGFGTIYLERHQLQLNLLMPGFQYEFGLLPNLTAGAEIGLSLATPSEGYSLSPAYRAFSRYYLNLKRRSDMGKNVSGNSGNYVAVTFNHYFTQWELLGNMDNSGRDLVFLGPVIGLQRSYPGGFSFSADAGAGWYFSNRVSAGLGPSVHIRIGWNPFGRARQRGN